VKVDTEPLSDDALEVDPPPTHDAILLASSADMARRLSFPPLGFLRANALASLTTSGRASAWLLRPSTFSPVAMRLRRRAAASFATRVVFSNFGHRADDLAHQDRG
jgi:hypothetical protein